MLVAEKTHHINTYIYGQGADYIVEVLKKAIPTIEVLTEDSTEEEGEEFSVVAESEWFSKMAEEMTPGVRLRIRRENKGMTQAELSEKTGVAIPNISLMESGKRPIGLKTAKKLSQALGCSVNDFV